MHCKNTCRRTSHLPVSIKTTSCSDPRPIGALGGRRQFQARSRKGLWYGLADRRRRGEHISKTPLLTQVIRPIWLRLLIASVFEFHTIAKEPRLLRRSI